MKINNTTNNARQTRLHCNCSCSDLRSDHCTVHPINSQTKKINIMPLYTIEITYDTRDPGVVATHTLHNKTGTQLRKLRDDIFFAGLYVPSKDHPATEGEIISPYRLRTIYVVMQPDAKK